jgi:very-short-patch-repair endonuclease
MDDGQQSKKEEKSCAVELKCSIATRVNVAFHQNSVPVIAEIELVNGGEEDLSDITVSVTAVPPFIKPKSFRLDLIRAGGTQHLNPVQVELDATFLLNLTEAVTGEISVVARSTDVEVARLVSPCQLLSPSEWTGLAAAPELIAAFVRPNDPSVDVILRNAAEKLRQAGREPALDGYRSHKKARAWELAEAIWAALSDEQIVYALPPQSFERNGQKVRWPSALLERKLGTCLDLALLFAACLEQAGLNSLVGFSEGHAFCGVWLTNEEFPLGVVDEAQTLRKRIRLEELILIETTLLTNQPPVRFRSAVEKAAALVSEDSATLFELVVDVRRARHRQIKPLALGAEFSPWTATVTAVAGANAEIESPPDFIEEELVVEATDEKLDRLQRWKRKLLDLSLRNKLLNFNPGKGAVTLVCPDPAKLEDMLADGRKIKLLPAANVMHGTDPRDANLHFRKAGEDAARRYAAEALMRGDVHTELTEDDLEERLIGISRTARNSFEEGGANSLYLAIGFLSWTPQNKAQTCKAPLLLVPVSLERRTVRSGFRLVRHDDDPRVNPTLLQLLRQDFKLIIQEFERELPVDASGLDVAQIWRIARQHIKDVQGFELTEDVVLSNFSFVKYLMWKDLVDRTDLLKRNPVVKHLIDTPKESYGESAAMPDERRLDDEVHPRDLFLPLPADSSQIAAVVAASRDNDFVLFGPPGTGKSQTIANMIVHLLAHNKTVLFVAEKTTALEVVRRRLNSVGLGSFCLEVHSAKAQKTSVLTQLKNAWESRVAEDSLEWDATTTDLKSLRDQLNAVVASLHRRHRNGLTAHSAMGRVIAGRDYLPQFTLPFESPDQHDGGDMGRLRDACRSIKTSLDAIGDPSKHPLSGVGRTNWSPGWQNQLVAAAREFYNVSDELQKQTAAVAALFSVSASGDPLWGYHLLTFAAQAFKKECESAIHLLRAGLHQVWHAFSAWKAIKSRYTETETGLSGTYRDGVFELDLVALLNEWREASNAMIFVRGGRKKRVRDTLASFAEASLPEDVSNEIARLIELKMLRDDARKYDTTLGALGRVWQGLSTDVNEIDGLFAWADATKAAAGRLASASQPEAFWIDALISFRERAATADARATFTDFLSAYEAFASARAEIVRVAETPDEWLGLPRSDAWLAEASTTTRLWERHSSQLQRWCKWREIAENSEKLGLGPLISAITSGMIVPDQIAYAFELGYARWWIEQIVERDDNLRGFVAEQHNDTIARFAELDDLVADLSKRVVASHLFGHVPPRTSFGRDPEFGTLAREIEKRARHMPLRQLFAQMPTALVKLAPCMMMSPLSVAQYLPADAKPFDVVIFDEASQIPVWDAIGAIARGKQVIVVGDPKQLPPTTFFDRTNDEHDDASDLEDLESILDECLAANIPHKRLAWHYRSRHESLIAFSNERYYSGGLVTFPSPVTDDRAVRYRHVPGGVYERGSGRVNREEARAVVQDVVRRLTELGFAVERRSLGIVTFNTEQQHLIEHLLDQERRARPELERFFGEEWHEPVFVKNLESVQGDERDIILFSVAYGPDASGRVSQNFGPLNKEGGARRLNVAITRARLELTIFATLKPDQIDLSRTKSAGVRDFKHFLEYAERGPRALAAAAAPLDRDTESPFEDAVRRALEERGWSVHPQVGVAGFRVDLGIVHPDAPGRYLAGVECDGASYHRSATARDRDLLRERVLRGLGWQIHRVWSTDWWVDTGRALDTLDAALRADLDAAHQDSARSVLTPDIDAGTDAPHSIDDSDDAATEAEFVSRSADTVRDTRAAAESLGQYADRIELDISVGSNGLISGTNNRQYQVADLKAAGFEPDRGAFYERTYRPTLRRMAAYVISVEGPIFDDLLVQRIARAHAFGRAAGRIRDIILDVVERRFPRSTEGDRRIFWPEGADKRQLPAFRPAPLDDRDHTDIPLPELASLALQFLKDGAEPDEAAVLVARELGLSRLREATANRFLQAAHLAKIHL